MRQASTTANVMHLVVDPLKPVPAANPIDLPSLPSEDGNLTANGERLAAMYYEMDGMDESTASARAHMLVPPGAHSLTLLALTHPPCIGPGLMPAISNQTTNQAPPMSHDKAPTSPVCPATAVASLDGAGCPPSNGGMLSVATLNDMADTIWSAASQTDRQATGSAASHTASRTISRTVSPSTSSSSAISSPFMDAPPPKEDLSGSTGRSTLTGTVGRLVADPYSYHCAEGRPDVNRVLSASEDRPLVAETAAQPDPGLITVSRTSDKYARQGQINDLEMEMALDSLSDDPELSVEALLELWGEDLMSAPSPSVWRSLKVNPALSPRGVKPSVAAAISKLDERSWHKAVTSHLTRLRAGGRGAPSGVHWLCDLVTPKEGPKRDASKRSHATVLVTTCTPEHCDIPHGAAEAAAITQLLRTCADVTSEHAVSVHSLDALLTGKDLWFFCGHADAMHQGRTTLSFVGFDGQPEVIDVTTLVSVVRRHAHTLRCIVLNGCQSVTLGTKLVEAGVQSVLCWEGSLDDDAARWYALGFANEIAAGGSPHDAFAAATISTLTVTELGRLDGSVLGWVQKFEFGDQEVSCITGDGHLGVRQAAGRVVCGMPWMLSAPSLALKGRRYLPLLPATYVSRRACEWQLLKCLHRIKRLVLSAIPAPGQTPRAASNAHVAVIVGGAGTGKSSLATWLVHERRTESLFPDGIIWVPFDADTSAAKAALHIMAALGHDIDASMRALVDNDMSTALATALRNRRCLIVLDGVWHGSQASPLISATTSPEQLIILTTRRRSLGVKLARGACLDLQSCQRVTDAEAISMLCSHVNSQPTWAELAIDVGARKPLQALATGRCHSLPIALELAASLISATMLKNSEESDAATFSSGMELGSVSMPGRSKLVRAVQEVEATIAQSPASLLLAPRSCAANDARKDACISDALMATVMQLSPEAMRCCMSLAKFEVPVSGKDLQRWLGTRIVTAALPQLVDEWGLATEFADQSGTRTGARVHSPFYQLSPWLQLYFSSSLVDKERLENFSCLENESSRRACAVRMPGYGITAARPSHSEHLDPSLKNRITTSGTGSRHGARILSEPATSSPWGTAWLRLSPFVSPSPIKRMLAPCRLTPRETMSRNGVLFITSLLLVLVLQQQPKYRAPTTTALSPVQLPVVLKWFNSSMQDFSQECTNNSLSVEDTKQIVSHACLESRAYRDGVIEMARFLQGFRLGKKTSEVNHTVDDAIPMINSSSSPQLGPSIQACDQEVDRSCFWTYHLPSSLAKHSRSCGTFGTTKPILVGRPKIVWDAVWEWGETRQLVSGLCFGMALLCLVDATCCGMLVASRTGHLKVLLISSCMAVYVFFAGLATTVLCVRLMRVKNIFSTGMPHSCNTMEPVDFASSFDLPDSVFPVLEFAIQTLLYLAISPIMVPRLHRAMRWVIACTVSRCLSNQVQVVGGQRALLRV